MSLVTYFCFFSHASVPPFPPKERNDHCEFDFLGTFSNGTFFFTFQPAAAHLELMEFRTSIYDALVVHPALPSHFQRFVEMAHFEDLQLRKREQRLGWEIDDILAAGG